ncbi:MAG: thioesterase family protein [Gemmatimonas sp.]
MSDELRVHVYPTDCDIVGHVNHATFLRMLERARWGSLEKKMSHKEFMDSGMFAIVRHVEISYEAEAKPGDDLLIRTGLASIGKTSFAVHQEVHNSRDVLVCRAKVVYVAVGKDRKPVPVPEDWRTMFSEWTDKS